MILLDANILMYAAGAAHPNKQPCLDLLARIARNEIHAGCDAEVLQEILHRYRAIGRWPEGRRLYDHARALLPVVVPVDELCLDEAARLLDAHPHLMARDALHAAVFLLSGASAFCSYDRDFDSIGQVRRREPGMI